MKAFTPAVLGLVSATTLLAACGSSTTSPGAASSRSLDDFLGFGNYVLEEEIQFNKDESLRQQSIAACMRQAGFDYTPEPAGVIVMQDDRGETVSFGESGDRAAAKNDDYVASLTDQRQVDYWRALTGRASPSEALTDADMERFDSDTDGRISYEESLRQGCRGEATAANPGVFYVQKVLGPAYDALQSDIRKEQTAALASLGSCEALSGITADLQDRELPAVLQAMVARGGGRGGEAAACLSAYESALAEARAAVEQAFYDANREVIDQYALPYDGRAALRQ